MPTSARSTDDDAYPPQRRIEACSALIDSVRISRRLALAAAGQSRHRLLVHQQDGQPALTDFDRAIALDPNNERAFRERSNTYRTKGRLDKALERRQ